MRRHGRNGCDNPSYRYSIKTEGMVILRGNNNQKYPLNFTLMECKILVIGLPIFLMKLVILIKQVFINYTSQNIPLFSPYTCFSYLLYFVTHQLFFIWRAGENGEVLLAGSERSVSEILYKLQNWKLLCKLQCKRKKMCYQKLKSMGKVISS